MPDTDRPPLGRRLLAELLGTALLVAVVVGSGIAAQQLSPNDVGLQLLENSTATFLGLTVLILLFGPVSGAHFNPVVSLADWFLGRRTGHGLPPREVGAYAVVQVVGAVAGSVLANLMFGVGTALSTKDRASGGHLLAEVVATTFLVALIFALARTGRGALAAPAVGAYIGAAYWFTSSTSFANPAVTIGRVFSDTFAGIAPASAAAFVIVQLVGLVVGAAVTLTLYPDTSERADNVIVPWRGQHEEHVDPAPMTPTSSPQQETPMDPSTAVTAGAAIAENVARDPYPALVDDLTYSYEGVFSAESVAAAVTDARETLEPMATVRTYLPILVARQAREQLTSAAQAEGRIAKTVPELLFVCVHNAGRSPMAAALAEHLSARRVHVRSAGSAPAGEVNPTVVQVLAERGITLEAPYPKPLSDNVVRAADVIITMGCGDACPIFPGKRYEDWDVADPAGKPIEAVRDIRDDIQARVTALLRDILD
jgi:protein-tyrosine-phosphatase/glycerol uptake facilitator-like aquaporin